MDMRTEEDQEEHLLVLVTDADHAGNRHDRKSTSSFQIFMAGSLIVRISLSSGESEFVTRSGRALAAPF